MKYLLVGYFTVFTSFVLKVRSHFSESRRRLMIWIPFGVELSVGFSIFFRGGGCAEKKRRIANGFIPWGCFCG